MSQPRKGWPFSCLVERVTTAEAGKALSPHPHDHIDSLSTPPVAVSADSQQIIQIPDRLSVKTAADLGN